MKLVEILARELKWWPHCVSIVQDYDGYVGLYSSSAPYLVNGDIHEAVWHHQYHIRNIAELSKIASDHATAIVTRADWEAERARIAKPAKKADKGGWIRHRGGKCPVDGEIKVETRRRGGQIVIENAQDFWWEHRSNGGDIMAYKLHKPAEQVEACSKPELKINLPDGYGEIYNAQAVERGPLQWRDRITEIDRTVEELEEERVALVQRLEGEGFRLIERAVQPVEDMSDWRNWKAGDQVKVILANDCTGLWIDRVVTVRSVEQANYGGSMPVSVFYDGDWNFPEADDGSERCVFEFHSRPSK